MLAREALAAYKQLAPENDHSIAACYARIGTIHADRGEHDEAVRELQEAVRIDQSIYPSDHIGLAHPMARLASSLQEVGRFDEAKTVISELVDRLQKNFEPSDVRTIESNRILVNTLTKFGRFEEADKLSESGLQASLEIDGAESGRAIDCMYARGVVLRGLNRLDAASDIFRRAFDISLKRSGPAGVGTTKLATDLAFTLRMQGRYREALDVCNPMIDALNRESPPDPLLPNLLRSAADAHAKTWGVC